MYDFNGTSWVQSQKLTDGTGVSGDWFGNAVDIFGDRAIVGSFNKNISGNSGAGSAFVYTLKQWFNVGGTTGNNSTGSLWLVIGFGSAVDISCDYVSLVKAVKVQL
ncbi:MAG: FG-GAP repeat protein [Chitinophagales bacterium]